MRRLHVAELGAGQVVLGEAEHRYLARVLRLRAGDRLVLFDGRGREADAVITRVGDADIALDVGDARALEGATLDLTLILPLLKGEKMELVMQKATELGVTRIVPAVAARSVVRLATDRAGGRISRWRRIAIEAARQCGRADLPAVADPVALESALREAPVDAFRVMFHESSTLPLRQVWPLTRAGAAVVAVGPEGGFTDDEVAAGRAAGFVIAGLGPRVLRAETAAITAVAIAAHILGDLG